MRLKKVRVQNYRSIIDSEEFEIEENKTILVGPNEAGKTAVLQAIQHLHPPEGVKPLSALRDYPRAHYNKIPKGEVKASDVRVVEAEFDLDDDDRAHLPKDFQKVTYVLWRNLDNLRGHTLNNAPERKRFEDIKRDLIRLAAHADKQFTAPAEDEDGTKESPSASLKTVTAGWSPSHEIWEEKAKALVEWLDSILPLVDEDNDKEEARACPPEDGDWHP